MAKRTIAVFEAQLHHHCLGPAILSGYLQLKKIGLSHLYASKMQASDQREVSGKLHIGQPQDR